MSGVIFLGDYGPVDSFINEEDIVGGIEPRLRRQRAVIRLCHILTQLGLQSPSEFIETPIFHQHGEYNMFQGLDGKLRETIYGK